MNRPEIIIRIRKLASLDMSVEALKALYLDLAAELDLVEARLSKDRTRKRRGNSMEIPGKVHGNGVEIPPRARKENNNLPSYLPTLITETVVITDSSSTPPTPSKPKTTEDPEGFTEFWKIYPKRDGSADRKGALKAWGPAVKRASVGQIILGARHFAEAMIDRGKTGTEFIPQARSWLNGDKWSETYGAYQGPANGRAQPNSIDSSLKAVKAAIADQLAVERGERERGGDPGREDVEDISRFRESYERANGSGHRKAG